MTGNGVTKMTLESGKELDRQCVLNWLYQVYCNPSSAFSSYLDDELKEFAHDAIALLKEKEPVEPIYDVLHGAYHCGNCKRRIILVESKEDRGRLENKYCFHCGRSVKWE